MNNKRIPPAVGEFAVGELGKLLARIAELEGALTDLLDCPASVVQATVPRAQLPSQGGEAVAWRVTGRGGITVTGQYPEWAEADCLLTITPLYTHPADQVADDLTMVKMSRELLEEIVELHRRRGVVLIIHVEQLGELLNGGRDE